MQKRGITTQDRLSSSARMIVLPPVLVDVPSTISWSTTNDLHTFFASSINGAKYSRSTEKTYVERNNLPSDPAVSHQGEQGMPQNIRTDDAPCQFRDDWLLLRVAWAAGEQKTGSCGTMRYRGSVRSIPFSESFWSHCDQRWLSTL
jgi:hypothetical protein